ncbi:MAG: hypothetical protein QM726_24925 [Chitinophagaceae bacterium]
MSRITPHIISFIVFLFSLAVCHAQTDVTVRASINRDKIIIGEPITLKLEAKVPNGADAKWFATDSLQHFEFINVGKVDTGFSGDNRVYQQIITITSFDSGRWAVPSLPLVIGNKEYLTDSLPVSVAYSNFDPNQDYHDIKDIVTVEYTATKYINWIILGVAVLSLLAVIYFLRQKAKRPIAPVVKKSTSKLTPLQEALEALDQLQSVGHTDLQAAKTYHTALNDILRNYLYRKTGIATMEKTSGELMVQLNRFNLPNNDFTLLAQTLRMNDAVKFAKYLPAETENQQALDTIKKAVQQLDTIIS